VEDVMSKSRGVCLAILGLLLVCAPRIAAADTASSTNAAVSPSHVVGIAEIQSRIDAQMNQEDTDRQAIQHLLARPEVQKIAGSAGIDMHRATAAASVLSGQQLKNVAARARVVDQGIGGAGSVTVTYTIIIIALLVLIIILVA
jgi:cell division protein FtsL